jgi:mannose-1-phosphate guanylyltransferase
LEAAVKAVILVGGEGTRLRPLTCNIPKPMIPVANRPFLEHVIDYLKQHGIAEVILSMGYKSEIIERHFGDGSQFGVKVTYVIEKSPLGTAGGVKNVEQHLDATCFVFNGDIMTDLDLQAILRAHWDKGAVVTIALTPVEDPTKYGLVETNGQGRIERFVEKPTADRVTTNLINAGTYVLERNALGRVPEGEYYMFERGLFPSLLQNGELMYSFPSDAYWVDIGTPETYLAVNRDMLRGRIARRLPGDEVQSGVWLGQNCQISASAKIVPPVYLGNGVEVGQDATITGPVVIGDNCQIGTRASIEDSVIWQNTTIGEGVLLKTCIIANDCTIADSSVVANGAIVADHCVVGSGNKLDKGVKIWPGKTIEASTITF